METAERLMHHSVTVQYGIPENHVVIEPPIDSDALGRLVADGVISESQTLRSFAEVGSTHIPFGKLILGAHAMDEATRKFADELRTHLQQRYS